MENVNYHMEYSYDYIYLQMRWLAVIMCLYAVNARTEEDQSLTSNPHEVPTINAIPEKCFYGAPEECPPPGSNPCKRITLSNISTENVAVLCCNLPNPTDFEVALYRASKIFYSHFL
jgi:hypothetical protein